MAESDSILIRGGEVLTLDGDRGFDPRGVDVLITGETITEIAPRIPADGHRVIDARGRIVMPGLVNAHVHSFEGLMRGRYHGMPLETWMLYAYPLVGQAPADERLIYLRTMLVGLEALRNGVTCILDDVGEEPMPQTLAHLGAVFRAYDDLGMRASCSGHFMDRHYLDTLPYAREMLPAELVAEIDNSPPPSATAFLDFATDALRAFHGKEGRLSFVLAPSGPQRCTEDLLVGAAELSRAHRANYHIHVLETKTQAVTAREFYGGSMIAYLERLGILSPLTTVAHALWIDESDAELIAGSGASVVHNPISNLKIGSGVAPFRMWLDAGINVALGSDGPSTNDSARLFDVMRMAALLHTVSSPDPADWPAPAEVLKAATSGGARAASLERVGTLAPGMHADVVLLDLSTTSFTPANDIVNQLIYCENGSSVETVIVHGEVVYDGGRAVRVDESQLLAELREQIPDFQRRQARLEELNARFVPHVDAIFRRCMGEELGLNRLIEPGFRQRSDGAGGGRRPAAPVEIRGGGEI